MNIEQLRNYCLTKKGVTECFPFDKDTLVFKVLTKMFALVPLEAIEFKVNLKCNPEKSIALREKYPEIVGAFHMNKLHWNSVTINQQIKSKLLVELIDHSYDLVVAKMTKKDKALLAKF